MTPEQEQAFADQMGAEFMVRLDELIGELGESWRAWSRHDADGFVADRRPWQAVFVDLFRAVQLTDGMGYWLRSVPGSGAP